MVCGQHKWAWSGKILEDATPFFNFWILPWNSWYWSSHHDQAFDQVKMELIRPTVLTMYDLEAETKVSADDSSFGLGAVLLQRHEGEGMWKPIAYASRSMTETEGRYAQIEKEALAVTWACEKFMTYILGKEIVIETDHKPLVSLLGGKNLDSLPPRILRYRLRLARFQYSIVHVPGKSLCTAPAQSPTQAIPADNPTPNRIMTRSRTGTIINPPQRFNPSSRMGDVTRTLNNIDHAVHCH